MGKGQLAAIVAASLALAAFSPPQCKREPAQQEPPTSWIPERKPETGPPITAPVDPPGSTTPGERVANGQSSQYLNPKGITCIGPKPSSSPGRAAREFVEAYSQAKAAVAESNFAEALALTEKAAPHASDARQWMAIEGLRIVALARLGDDVNLIATLEALNALNCSSPEQAVQHQNLLDGARERLKGRSAH